MLLHISLLHYPHLCVFFFFNDTATTEIYTLSLHDALPICLLGLSGAAGGAAAGDLMEKRIAGLPHDELFVYEDALRQGRTVVFVEVEDEMSAEAVRQGFAEGGAETVDAARERWWIGLRSAEKESYSVDGGNFERDEVYYRKGFETALSPGARGKTLQGSARVPDPGVPHQRRRSGLSPRIRAWPGA